MTKQKKTKNTEKTEEKQEELNGLTRKVFPENLMGVNFWSDPQDPGSFGFRFEKQEDGSTKLIMGHRKTKKE